MKATCDKALRFLATQCLPPTPQNYWTAFAFQRHADRGLDQAVSAIIDGGVRLTQANADCLYETYIGQGAAGAVPPQDVAADRVRHQALRLTDLAASATLATGEFGRELAQCLPAIGTADAASLRALVAAMVEWSQRSERELSATAAEIGELRQKLESVQDDAERDALTGLPNRRGIEARLAAACHARADAVIAICDIDRFKSYNDRYGHVVGDRVLKTVAQSLAESLHDHFVGRWGGEEFLVVARTDVASGVVLLDRAKEALAARHFKLRETDEPIGRITFSAGVTPLRIAGKAWETAVERADALLYRAKNEGRNRVIGDTAGG